MLWADQHGNPAAVLASDALERTDRREIAADDFFQGLFTTALEEGEIITEVRFPEPERTNYRKLIHPASRFALVGCSWRSSGTGCGWWSPAPSENGVVRWRGAEAARGSDFRRQAVEGLSVAPDGMIGDLHGTP